MKDERNHKDRYENYEEQEQSTKDMILGIVLFAIIIIFALIGESLLNLIF